MGRLDAPKSCNYYWQIMSIMMCLIPLWLYSLMLPTLFALCPGNLNSMFWPVRHPVPTTMVRVAGVLVGVDAWVKTFVAKKARSVIRDVDKLDVVSDRLLHNQLLHFCQNACMAFLGLNTPTPLFSELMEQVDDTIVEAVCRHGTGGGHLDWSPHLRKFANMKIQEPHFRGGFGITPNEGSAISAFYSVTCALVFWLGNHGGNRRMRGRPG